MDLLIRFCNKIDIRHVTERSRKFKFRFNKLYSMVLEVLN